MFFLLLPLKPPRNETCSEAAAMCNIQDTHSLTHTNAHTRWVDYHRSVGRSISAAEVAERLVWAAQQLLPGMLRAAWVSRKHKW